VTLELYRRRAFTSKVEVSRAMRRAFDTAVRTKPPAFAADAALCTFNGVEGGVEVQQSGAREDRR
jgi:hypothetical protein